MNECIGHVIGKPHSPVTGLYIGKILSELLQRNHFTVILFFHASRDPLCKGLISECKKNDGWLLRNK